MIAFRPFMGRSRLGQGAVAALTDATMNQALSAPRAAVKFWSPSCPACVSFKPAFEAAAQELGGQVLMAEALVDQAPAAAGQFEVAALPTTVFLANGREVGRMEGAGDKADLLGEIQRAFAVTQPTGPQPTGTAYPSPVAPAPASSALPLVLVGLAAAGVAVYLLVK